MHFIPFQKQAKTMRCSTCLRERRKMQFAYKSKIEIALARQRVSRRLTKNQVVALSAVQSLNGGYHAQVKRRILTETGINMSGGRLHEILANFVAKGWLTRADEKKVAARGRQTVHVYRMTGHGRDLLNAAKVRMTLR